MAATRRRHWEKPQVDDEILDLPPDAPLKVPRGSGWSARKRGLVISARRELITNYLLRGWTSARIAEELQISESLIHFDVEAVRAEWRDRAINNVEREAVLDVARLDFIVEAMIPGVLEGDYHAADTMQKAVMAKATILGYRNGVGFDFERFVRDLASGSGYDPDVAVTIAQKVSLTMKAG